MATESLYDPDLWRKLEERSIPEPNSGCLLWLLYTMPSGYGQMKVPGTRESDLVHRLSWIANFGPITGGRAVCHKCDVRPCIEPTHLFLGTQTDNMADKVQKGRQSKGEAHGGAVLDETMVLAIRIAVGSQSAIAKQFGISQGHVWRIRHRKKWQHLA